MFYKWISFFILFASSSCLSQQTLQEKDAPYDSLVYGQHKSGYEDLEPAMGGSKSVRANLATDDEYKRAWIKIDRSKKLFKRYYKFKNLLKKKYNLALGLDYMFLNQYASFSFSDRQASSGIFRVYTTWTAFKKSDQLEGSLIFKFENRHNIGSGVTPRNLGYEAGAALSTASFKEFQWGLTNLYWKQLFRRNRVGFVIGQMDPGDWVDLFPLLDSYRYYLNEAYFNSPAMALPNQGFGLAGQIFVIDRYYLKGGIHDANGEPNKFGGYILESFFNTREYFSWIEAGWSPQYQVLAGESIHLTYWHQDARTSTGSSESRGWCFSASTFWPKRWHPFIRIDISEGNAALMRRLLIAGLGINVNLYDYLGLAFNWGSPVDKSKRDQFAIEVFYNLQLMQHVNVTPDIQLTFNPSFNPDKSVVGIYSVLRIRYAM